jgi:hypothetical protein
MMPDTQRKFEEVTESPAREEKREELLREVARDAAEGAEEYLRDSEVREGGE